MSLCLLFVHRRCALQLDANALLPAMNVLGIISIVRALPDLLSTDFNSKGQPARAGTHTPNHKRSATTHCTQ